MSNQNRHNRRNHAPNEMMLRRTLVLMIVCGILAFAVLGLRLFRLQLVEREKYASMAIEQQVRQTTVTAARGTIYDRKGTVLAASADVYTIFLSPAEIAKNKENPYETPEFIAEHLSKILNIEYNKLYNYFGFYDAIQASDYFRKWLIDGFLAFEIVYNDDGYIPNGSNHPEYLPEEFQDYNIQLLPHLQWPHFQQNLYLQQFLPL